MKNNQEPLSSSFDERLLDDLRNGNQKAFESIFFRYNARVYNFINSLVGNSALSEDMTQSVFLTLWENRTTLDSSKNFDAFIFTIARNMVYRHTEKMLNTYRYEEYVKTHISEAEYFNEDHIDKDVIEKLIMDLLEKLPPARRKIFLLKLREGKTNKEIASLLSISEKTVSTQIQRSIDFFKKNISDYSLFMALLFVIVC